MVIREPPSLVRLASNHQKQFPCYKTKMFNDLNHHYYTSLWNDPNPEKFTYFHEITPNRAQQKQPTASQRAWRKRRWRWASCWRQAQSPEATFRVVLSQGGTCEGEGSHQYVCGYVLIRRVGIFVRLKYFEFLIDDI